MAIPRLNYPSQRVTQPIIDLCPHLKGLDIPPLDSKYIMVLLGANVLNVVLHTELRRGTQGQTAAAVNTSYFWTLTRAMGMSC